MDTFVEISRGDLPKVRDLLRARTDWPRGVEGYCLLDTQLSHLPFIEIYNLKFYCPGGDISQGMVAVSDKPEYYEVYVCPINSSGLIAIEDALIKTKLIDWSREVTVPSADSEIVACLKRVREKLALKIIDENPACKLLLERNANPLEISDPPENTYVGPLKPEFLNLVNLTWTFYSGRGSYDNFKALMEEGRTYVLYSSKDHRPVSWITADHAGAYTHLYCLGQHRRKGYSEYISKVATNDLLAKRKDVLTYTLEDNVKPHNLFRKLGFEFIERVWWVCLTKEIAAQ